jgi:arylformamidase
LSGKNGDVMSDNLEQGPESTLLSALAEFEIHDASPTIRPGMPMFVAFDGPEIAPQLTHTEIGVAANTLTMAEHTGTHIDAPFHFDPAGLTIDQVDPATLLLRRYKKFDLTPDDPQPGMLVGVEALREAAHRGQFTLDPGDVALIEMGWDRFWTDQGEHTHDFWGTNMPGLDDQACEYLVEAGVIAVGSDTAACDNALKDGEIVSALGHTHWFLPRGIVIVEGLMGLSQVPATGLIIALPLRIAGGSGSPVRVLLLHRASAG